MTTATPLSPEPRATAARTHDVPTSETPTSAATAVAMREALARMQAATRGRPAPDHDARVASLERLADLLVHRQDAIVDAVRADFGNRSRHETLLAEVFSVLEAIRFTKRHLATWMEHQPRRVGWAYAPARAEVIPQPLGVVGIISPWNYPVQLALAPLVNALAAGNRAMIKPSEYVPATAELLRTLLAETFAPDEVAVFTGGADVGEAFAGLPFDHLVFTGSTRVGKLVMRAASANLTPVTLELGGKSPALVSRRFPVDEAAARVMLGKLFNAGQTCVAPDYVLVPRESRDAFVGAAAAAVRSMFPTLANNPDYTAIINDAHYDRLRRIVDDARARGASVLEVNPADEDLAATRRFPPTFVLDATGETALMQEEIFGPVLPVKTYDSFDEALAFVNANPRPLALYYFGYDRAETERVLAETTAGGVGVNETLLHVGQDDLPFGGVGPSGMGHYHGYEGFATFSKMKPVFHQARVNGTFLLRPPFGRAVDAFLKLVLR